MSFLLYRLILNLKWFLSTIIGCLIAAIWLVLPFSFESIFLMAETGEFNLDFGWRFLLEMVGMYAIAFWFIGRGMKKYHPPLKWSTDKNKTILIIFNILLILPPVYFAYSLFTESYYYSFESVFLSQLLAFPSLFFLLLMNKKITNEDLELAKTNSEKEEVKLPEGYQRRVRTSIILLAISSLVSIFLVVYANIQSDMAEKQLDIERLMHQSELEELNIQIDSLTSELETIRLKNDTTDSLESPE